MLVVASLAMLRQDDPAVWRQSGRARSALLLAGALAGLSAWTKNEGAVFLAASGCLVAWIAVRHGPPRDLAWWIGGAGAGAALVGWFKLVVMAVRRRSTVRRPPGPRSDVSAVIRAARAACSG